MDRLQDQFWLLRKYRHESAHRMNDKWKVIDRAIMGEAWIESRLADHVGVLCEEIGVRWAGTENERRAADYVTNQFKALSLENAAVEEFELQTARCGAASIRVVGDESRPLDVRPCMFCPPLEIAAPLVDVGYGMPSELAPLSDRLPGAIVLIDSDFEPFTKPRLLTLRLRDLVQAGAAAAISSSPHQGRRLTHVSAADWRDGDPTTVVLPLVQTSREDAASLKRLAATGVRIRVDVESNFRKTASHNSVADLPGDTMRDECIVLGAHHDTTPDSYGANDNAAGVAVLLETARILAKLSDTSGGLTGRTIRFVSFGAEEQGLQGSTAFVDRHWGPGTLPKLMINLDELATGQMKGVVLQFPELRSLVQKQFDSMNEGLQCHVLAQLDASGDMFPFARSGIPSAFLWRWRFVGRHPDTAFGHSSADTPEKLRIRELKEYAGLLARLLLRLSHVPTADWPENRLDADEIAVRIQSERGAVFRTM